VADRGDLDVVGIGNALVDVLTHAEDGFLARQSLIKGTMHLVDEPRAREIYDAMGPGVEISGGSAANTVVGVASFGGRAHYVGKVRDDQLGEVFGHDLRATGVGYDTPRATEGPPTGRCLILVTPDAQRTMSTFLGASVRLGPGDIDRGLITRGRILYLEGYLFDPPEAQEAFRTAAAIAHAAGRKVSLTLSDPFCVGRHRQAFLDLVEHHVDILFANEAEICALYEVDFDAALARVRGHCEIAALTRSEKGSVILGDGRMHTVAPHPVAEVVDTTGAGDLYAAGVLYGLSQGLDLPTCGRLGSLAAAEVIAHVGARPTVPLAQLAGPILG
jgi:sugar/nucleoside kinase (ribokinase family)